MAPSPHGGAFWSYDQLKWPLGKTWHDRPTSVKLTGHVYIDVSQWPCKFGKDLWLFVEVMALWCWLESRCRRGAIRSYDKFRWPPGKTWDNCSTLMKLTGYMNNDVSQWFCKFGKDWWLFVEVMALWNWLESWCQKWHRCQCAAGYKVQVSTWLTWNNCSTLMKLTGYMYNDVCQWFWKFGEYWWLFLEVMTLFVIFDIKWSRSQPGDLSWAEKYFFSH